MVFIPIRLRNQIWDKYHFSGTQLWLRAHGSAEKNNNRAWCARCMDHFERYWNICAKPACDQVHPVAVVTASSRISRDSRAGWPTVLSTNGRRRVRLVQCSSIPMIGREEQQHAANSDGPSIGSRSSAKRRRGCTRSPLQESSGRAAWRSVACGAVARAVAHEWGQPSPLCHPTPDATRPFRPTSTHTLTTPPHRHDFTTPPHTTLSTPEVGARDRPGHLEWARARAR